MAEAKGKFESVREWIVEHKLRTVGKSFFFFFFPSFFFLFETVLFLVIWVFCLDLGLMSLFSGKGCLWLSGIVGSIAYNWSQPNMKTSVRIIHAR